MPASVEVSTEIDSNHYNFDSDYYSSESENEDELCIFPGDDSNHSGEEDQTEDDESDEEIEIKRTMFEPLDLGPPTYECEYCKAVMWFEKRNCKKDKKNPKFSLCCKAGKVVLPLFETAPLLLQQLDDPNGGKKSRNYQEQKRAYNSMFAMTSMGGQIDHTVNDGRGPYVFKLNGQNHHRIGSLLPTAGQMPKFMQLYFHDTENEVSNRIRAYKKGGEDAKLDRDTVAKLIAMLNEVNALVKVFKTARERFADTRVE